MDVLTQHTSWALCATKDRVLWDESKSMVPYDCIHWIHIDEILVFLSVIKSVNTHNKYAHKVNINKKGMFGILVITSLACV